MNKYVGIGIGVIVLSAGVFFLIRQPSAAPSSGSSSSGTFGQGENLPAPSQTGVTGSGSTQNTTSGAGSGQIVATVDGGSVQVNDFLNSPDTVSTSTIPNNFFLVGGLTPVEQDAPYSIFYVSTDQSFNVTLLKEPIKFTRLQAEQDLMQRLGLGKNDMCRLKYWVGVPLNVDQKYAGTNLGFSFCPGAVALP